MNIKYSKEEMIALYKSDMDMMIYAQTINTGAKSRVEEIIRFSQVAGYKKIGIAHCISVTREAVQLQSMLESKFEVARVHCKVGGISKDDLLGDGWGAACNPIMQAKVLEGEKTDLNIVMGLCLGHDMLFAKYSAAPSTTFLTKDELYNNIPIKGLR